MLSQDSKKDISHPCVHVISITVNYCIIFYSKASIHILNYSIRNHIHTQTPKRIMDAFLSDNSYTNELIPYELI